MTRALAPGPPVPFHALRVLPLAPSPTARAVTAIRRPRARRALLLTGIALLIALGTWGAAHVIEPGALADAFAAVSWPWVAASGVVYAVGQIASGLVWGVGLRAGGMRGVHRRHVQSAHWLGHGAGELLPAQLGHIVRYAAIRRHPAAAAGGGLRIAGSVGAWKVVDGLVTFVVVALAAMVMPLPEGLGGLRWIAGATLAGLLIALLAVYRIGAARVARRLPPRIAGVVRGLAEGAAVLARRRDAAAAVGLQLIAVCARVASLAALLHAFGMPAEAAVLVFALMVLSGVVAISPGNVGVRDAALVPALVATYGLSAEPALAFSLGIQATATGVSLLGAAVALVLMRLSRPAPLPA
jgi:uncharacterized membrane protein YbhN (UPF0104 family)